MEKVLTYTLREEDMKATAGGLVNLVLRNCVKVTGHEISAAKFTPDGITCDGALIHVSERMKPGQTLRVVLPEERDETKLIPTPGPVRVLYEDEDLIAVDKLPGEVVHPGPGHYTDTIANRITWYLQQQTAAVGNAGDAAKALSGIGAEEESRRETSSSAAADLSVSGAHGSAAPASGLRVIGRLDKETSGVLIYAKNRAAAARLQRQRRDGTFVRTYLAVCEGTFPDRPETAALEASDAPDAKGTLYDKTGDGTVWYKTGTIDLPLEKEPGVLMRMRVAKEGGLRAVTHYEVLKEFHTSGEMKNPAGSREERQGNLEQVFSANVDMTREKVAEEATWKQACSLLRVTIETGRTHQIRVHMAAIGHPLVGDTLYGRGAGAAQDEDHVKSMPATENRRNHPAGPERTITAEPPYANDPAVQHALLHAAEVRLLQPFTGKPLCITSQRTQEFTKLRNTRILETFTTGIK